MAQEGIDVRRDAGRKQFATIPRASGGIARLAYARAEEAGIALSSLLSASGLTIAQIENRRERLKVKAQIRLLGLVADALGDDLLGFHLAHNFDLREIGLLYYVMASSEVLEDALRRVERYSRIVNEGISIQVHTGKHVTIRLNDVGVERHSDRHQIEFWLTTFIRICRQLTRQAPGTEPHTDSAPPKGTAIAVGRVFRMQIAVWCRRRRNHLA